MLKNSNTSHLTFSLTILGSSSALPRSDRFPTAHLLNVNERFFLIDCGEGTQIQLRRFKQRFGKINHIFISHLHGDHMFGLFGILSSFHLLGRKNDLTIFGPAGLESIIKFYKTHFSAGEGFNIRIIISGSRGLKKILENDKIEVYSFPLKHRITTFGYLFREKPVDLNLKKEALDIYKPSIEEVVQIKKGMDLKLHSGEIIPNRELTLPPWKTRSYAFCSDTAYSEKIVDYIKNVDLLYHEATFEHKDHELAKSTLHSTSKEAASIAKKAKVKKLIVGHYSSRYKEYDTLVNEAQEVFANTFGANDGDVFEVERKRET